VNAELCRKALEKVGNPNILVNIVSRRVRQLNSGAGAISRPLIPDAANLGAADIALREIVEGKLGWELPEPAEAVGTAATKKRRKPAWR
jgi:DNA-directed RNA polymerase subunit omega